jgi:hypothetical protein
MDARTNVRLHVEEIELGLPDGALGAVSLGQWIRRRGQMVLHEPTQVEPLRLGAWARRNIERQDGVCNYTGGTIV